MIVGWLHLNGPFWLDVKVEPVNGRLVELLWSPIQAIER